MTQKTIKPPLVDAPFCNTCPYFDLNTANQITPEYFRTFRAAFEKTQTITTQNTINYTEKLNIFIYDYSYLVVNVGSNAAVAYLEISPDGTNWETQSAIKTIPVNLPSPATQHTVSFVSSIIAKYARLACKSAQVDSPTTLDVYIQGR